jgi:F0F1-type ATP synthase delta subunit|tara:strand:+ start:669 stop:896 length:228 start_codon:yes stop_codon:yes gene_type:complete
MSKQKLTKKQKEELQSLVDEITFEAKELRLDYENNNSDLSGSVVHIHENSPFLDVNENDELTYSGSRWRHVLKSF